MKFSFFICTFSFTAAVAILTVNASVLEDDDEDVASDETLLAGIAGRRSHRDADDDHDAVGELGRWVKNFVKLEKSVVEEETARLESMVEKIEKRQAVVEEESARLEFMVRLDSLFRNVLTKKFGRKISKAFFKHIFPLVADELQRMDEERRIRWLQQEEEEEKMAGIEDRRDSFSGRTERSSGNDQFL